MPYYDREPERDQNFDNPPLCSAQLFDLAFCKRTLYKDFWSFGIPEEKVPRVRKKNNARLPFKRDPATAAINLAVIVAKSWQGIWHGSYNGSLPNVPQY